MLIVFSSSVTGTYGGWIMFLIFLINSCMMGSTPTLLTPFARFVPYEGPLGGVVFVVCVALSLVTSLATFRFLRRWRLSGVRAALRGVRDDLLDALRTLLGLARADSPGPELGRWGARRRAARPPHARPRAERFEAVSRAVQALPTCVYRSDGTLGGMTVKELRRAIEESGKVVPPGAFERADLEALLRPPRDDSSTHTCPICFEDYADLDTLRVLPCEHCFHLECVDRWFLAGGPNADYLKPAACPLCNRQLDIKLDRGHGTQAEQGAQGARAHGVAQEARPSRSTSATAQAARATAPAGSNRHAHDRGHAHALAHEHAHGRGAPSGALADDVGALAPASASDIARAAPGSAAARGSPPLPTPSAAAAPAARAGSAALSSHPLWESFSGDGDGDDNDDDASDSSSEEAERREGVVRDAIVGLAERGISEGAAERGQQRAGPGEAVVL